MRAIFFFNDTATTEIYTLSLHDALPICYMLETPRILQYSPLQTAVTIREVRTISRKGRSNAIGILRDYTDRKSTRLNSSHPSISYAVFCLKKKKKMKTTPMNFVINKTQT